MTQQSLQAFLDVDRISYRCRNFNSIRYGQIYVSGVTNPLYTRELFPALGITPAQLVNIYSLLKEGNHSYDALGSVGGPDGFGLLATLLNKTIDVCVTTGEGEVINTYTVTPLTPIEAIEAASRWTRHCIEADLRQREQAARDKWWRLRWWQRAQKAPEPLHNV